MDLGQLDTRAGIKLSNHTFDQSYPLGGALEPKDNETKVFEGDIVIPPNAQPSYQGSISHEWQVRGRLEAFGNDPDSGYQTIVVR